MNHAQLIEILLECENLAGKLQLTLTPPSERGAIKLVLEGGELTIEYRFATFTEALEQIGRLKTLHGH